MSGITSYQFKPSAGRADNRVVIVARCVGTEPEAAHDGIDEETHQRWVERLSHIEAATLDGEVYRFVSGADFWAWADVCRRKSPNNQVRLRPALIVLGDANRDLALMGTPLGYEWPLKDGHRQHPINLSDRRIFMAEMTKADDEHRKVGRLYLAGIGNLHPEGIYSGDLSIVDMVRFVAGWRKAIDDHDIGPTMCSTLAAQSERSMLAYLHRTGKRPIRWHDDNDLYRFEYGAKAASAPYRKCRDGTYPRLYHTDFTAYYLHVMATYPLPEQCVGWWPDGADIARLRRYLDGGRLVIAHAVTADSDGEVVVLTTPQIDVERIVEVRAMSAYRPTDALAGWARHMYAARQACDDKDVRTAMKAVGCSLWGRMGRRNHAIRWSEHLPVEWTPRQQRIMGDVLTRVPTGEAVKGPKGTHTMVYRVQRSEMLEPGEVDLHGTFSIGGVAQSRQWDIPRWDGTGRLLNPTSVPIYGVIDEAMPRQRRSHALAAHVLAYGRLLMDQLEADVGAEHVVYGHTDSLWTTSQPRGTSGRKHMHGEAYAGLGDLPTVIERDVEISDGARWVGGNVSAAPGAGRVGSRMYLDYDDARSAAGEAMYVERGRWALSARDVAPL